MLRWVVGAIALVVLAVALWAFEPWRLFTSSRVDEALPSTEPQPTDPEHAEPPEPVELGAGDFEDAEHGTTDRARILELADGRRFVRLEELATSDGPDLVVALSDAPSGGDWGSYDDGRYLDLGDLEATHGNQNYEIPADVDLGDFSTVVVWCDRFDVAFGTADLAFGTATLA